MVSSGGGRRVRNNSPTGRISLVDRLYKEIRDKIITWGVSPNEILVETRLAEEYQVSKTPVREALALLSQDGLVEVLPRVGYRVTSISIQDIHEIFDLRVLLEGEAAAQAAVKAPRNEITALRDSHLARAEELSKETASVVEYLHFHDAFHSQIAELSGNARLARFVGRLLRDGARLRMIDPLMSWSALEEEQKEAKRICKAFFERDAESAQQIMRDHIIQSKSRTLEFLIQRGTQHKIELRKETAGTEARTVKGSKSAPIRQ